MVQHLEEAKDRRQRLKALLQEAIFSCIARQVAGFSVTRCNLLCNVVKVEDYSTFPATRNAIVICETGWEEGLLHAQFRPQQLQVAIKIASCNSALTDECFSYFAHEMYFAHEVFFYFL